MNALRRILVHVDGSPRSATRLRLARRLGQAQGAGVEAVFAVTPAWMELPLSAMGDASAGVLLQEAEAARRRDARAVFERENEGPGPLATWDEGGSEAAIPALATRALCSDLLVLGQHDRNDPLAWGVPSDFVPSVLADSGRPALVVPWAGEVGEVGRRVLVAWKDSREAARALSAALPLLQAAEQVDIALWREPTLATEGEEAPESLSRLQTWLAAHGLTPRIRPQGAASAELGERLLSLAADVGADLLVMGCYGHTRAREWLLGGATRTVLSSMTLPVLMAH